MRVCEVCGVYEPFANRTDMCCLAFGKGPCVKFVPTPRDINGAGLSLRFQLEKETKAGSSEAAGAGSQTEREPEEKDAMEREERLNAGPGDEGREGGEDREGHEGLEERRTENGARLHASRAET